jgi:hypothetical protein
MVTLTIRDVPDDILKSVDAAARVAQIRSREAFLRKHLNEVYGPEGSVAAATAQRLRKIMQTAAGLGERGWLDPAPTISLVARALGHRDASAFESELRGERALTFGDGDGFCALFGVERSWLESGVGNPFEASALFRDGHDVLAHFLTRGIEYDELCFVLADAPDVGAAIVGVRSAPHPLSPDGAWRYNILADLIPIHDHVGGTGRANRREFADLMVALYDNELFTEQTAMHGRIVNEAQYMALVSGGIHAAEIVGDRSLGSHWHEDFWQMERQDVYTKNYGMARDALREELLREKIQSTDQYHNHVRKLCEQIRGDLDRIEP